MSVIKGEYFTPMRDSKRGKRRDQNKQQQKGKRTRPSPPNGENKGGKERTEKKEKQNGLGRVGQGLYQKDGEDEEKGEGEKSAMAKDHIDQKTERKREKSRACWLCDKSICLFLPSCRMFRLRPRLSLKTDFLS